MTIETMPSEEERAKAAKVAEAWARECFPSKKIVKVLVNGNSGPDGEPVLSIHLVFDIPKDSHVDFDAHIKYRHNLDLKLREAGIYTFPVPYYALLSELEDVA